MDMIFSKGKTVFLLLISITLFYSCSTENPGSGTPWSYYTKPAEAGFNAERLDDVANYIKDSTNTTGIMAIYDGKVIFEHGNIEELSYLASCRKSILSMLYGRYVENGSIDLQTTIGELGLDEDDGLLESEKAATVDHLITARSGVFHVPSNGGYDEDNILERGAVAPGEYFVYNNWDFNAAGYVFEQYVGKSIYEELESQLALPMGFEDWDITAQRKYYNEEKSRYPAYHIYLSTRDMAKVGQLMLQGGEWQGEQLIPTSWTEKIVTPVTPRDTVSKRIGRRPTRPEFSYAYMWWCFDEFKGNPIYKGSYTASGYGGQWITVIPEMKMVIAHKTKFGGDDPQFTRAPEYWEIVDRLVKARD
jgi:CubicO group peptidase (beta-lactamase class C family)